MKTRLGKINFKPKFGSLSQREFILVVFMIIAIEGYLLYAYLIKPVYDDYMASVFELTESINTLNNLKGDYDRKGEMEQEILRIEGELEDIQKQLPAFLSQEEVVLSIEDISANSGLQIKVLGMIGAGSLPLKAIPADTIVAQQAAIAAPVPMFADQIVALNFTGDYTQLYSFLKSVESSSRKMSAKGVVINVDQTGVLGGNINLSYPSLWDESVGQKPYIMDPAPSFAGKGSMFDKYSGYSEIITKAESGSGKQTTITPDFYLKVNSYLNNSAKIFISNSYNTNSEARYDGNDVTRATMTINGGNGIYTYKYSLGNFNIDGSRQTEIKEGKIRLEVLVQSRRSEDDNVGLILDIVNNTDVPAEITVKGDDLTNPRFIIGNTAGNVIVK